MNVHPILAVSFPDSRLHVEDGHIAEWLTSIGLTKHAFMFVLAGLLTLLFFGGYAAVAQKRRVPSRYGNFVETIICFIRDQMVRPFMGENGDKFIPILASCFVYILFCNLLGLIPLFDFLGHGGNTSTANIKVTGGLAVCAFLFYHISGIREQGGIWTYIKNLFPHVPVVILPLIIVVELAAHAVRPCALAIRLFANMYAGHTMMATLLGFTVVLTKDFLIPGIGISFVAAVAATLLTFLELLVAVIQAFVFTFLTTVFLAGAVHPEH